MAVSIALSINYEESPVNSSRKSTSQFCTGGEFTRQGGGGECGQPHNGPKNGWQRERGTTPCRADLTEGHQVLRDAPGFSHGEVSRCLRSRQSIWCSPQGWDTPGFSHGEEVTRLSRQDQSVSGRQTPPGGTFRTFLSPSPFLAHISPPRVRRFMGHSLLGCGPSGSQVISRWSFLYLS
jgi:hypothetical protein